jgi:hypothetical protein
MSTRAIIGLATLQDESTLMYEIKYSTVLFDTQPERFMPILRDMKRKDAERAINNLSVIRAIYYDSENKISFEYNEDTKDDDREILRYYGDVLQSVAHKIWIKFHQIYHIYLYDFEENEWVYDPVTGEDYKNSFLNHFRL